MSMLKPLGDHVIIEMYEPETEKTASGIYLPDTHMKDKPMQGKVLAVGSGKLLDDGTRVKAEVKVGDQVVFAKYSGTEFTLDEKKYLVISDRDILAIIEG